ncbi:pseudouridine synthase [Arcanobacterium hippocoleae]
MRRKRSERRAAKRANIAPPLRGRINASEIKLPEFSADGTPVSFKTLGEWAEAGWGGEALAAFDRGDYFADGNVRLSAADPYRAGKRVWVFRPVLDEPAEPIELTVVEQTQRYLVVEKPHGMATIPRGSHVANTVTVAARRQFQNDLLAAAHRLDLETAGLVLLTKAPEYRAKYQSIFQRREIRKTYYAAAPILDEFADGGAHEVNLPLFRPHGQIWVSVFAPESQNGQEFLAGGGKVWNSRTEVKLVREIGDNKFSAVERSLSGHRDFQNLPARWGIYELRPHSGYLHQLRVTMLHFGAPIFGDPLYPRWMTKAEEAARAFPLQLLARELEFADPYTGERLHFVSHQRLALDICGDALSGE